MKLTKEIAQKVKQTVECGLVSGIGEPIPGQMCVEAAVCYAYGLPHSDNPPCVGYAVRCFKIGLNDSNWSSNEARAKGMIKISIAQLDSNVLDQKEFAKRVTLLTINRIIAPLAGKHKPEIKEKLEMVTDLLEAVTLCRELQKAADADAADAATRAACAAHAGYAADAAARAACAAADAGYAAAGYAARAACAAADAGYAAAGYAADAADADAGYAAARAACAAADADAAAIKDRILIQAADICLEVLKEMKSPGCEYLYLIEN